jgi:ABC-type bacteriocin/lantibiotic exporter with double-glycine peptidase domain
MNTPLNSPIASQISSVVGDDSIVHASLWMLLILTLGVALLTLVFAVVVRCGKWCSRSVTQRVASRSNTWAQV